MLFSDCGGHVTPHMNSLDLTVVLKLKYDDLLIQEQSNQDNFDAYHCFFCFTSMYAQKRFHPIDIYL